MCPCAARRPGGPKECLGTAHQCRSRKDSRRHTLCRHARHQYWCRGPCDDTCEGRWLKKAAQTPGPASSRNQLAAPYLITTTQRRDDAVSPISYDGILERHSHRADDQLRRSGETARRLPGAGGGGIASGLPARAQVVERRAGRDDTGRARAGAYSTSQHASANCELPWAAVHHLIAAVRLGGTWVGCASATVVALHPRCYVPCSTQPTQVDAHMASFTAVASNDDVQKAQLLREALEQVSQGIQDAISGMPARGGDAHQIGGGPSSDGQARSPAPHSELHAAR